MANARKSTRAALTSQPGSASLGSRVAIYARFSTDSQRETSLDDQIRRCKDLARQHGLTVNENLIFTDKAVSGTEKGDKWRHGYKALYELLSAGKIDVLIADEFSRLSRDVVGQARLIHLLEKNKALRLITADGHDTHQPNWQLQIGLSGLIAQNFVRETRHRVIRGMEGVLERGYMCATPPLGYKLKQILDDNAVRLGTDWEIDEDRAELVREIFQMRADGQSMHQIARTLNERKEPTESRGRRNQAIMWRPSRIKTLLANPIYRGVFYWNNSVRYKAEMKARGLEAQVKEFPRPHLRIVSDRIWFQCEDRRKISTSGYGGATHPLAGLVSCGVCRSTLVLTAKSHRSRSLYCANCTVAKSVSGATGRLTSTIQANGVKHLLMTVLVDTMTPEAISTYKALLKSLLEGNFEEQITRLEERSKKLGKQLDRLATLLQKFEEDERFVAQYGTTKAEKSAIDQELADLYAKNHRPDQAVIQAQIKMANPVEILLNSLRDDQHPERVRTLLHRIFTEISFEGKTSKYTSTFTILPSVAAAMAIGSNTREVIPPGEPLRYQLQFWRKQGKDSVAEWRVTCLGPANSTAAYERSAIAARAHKDEDTLINSDCEHTVT